MTTDVITPTEAWEAVERLRIDVHADRRAGGWYASMYEPDVNVTRGKTPIEAIATLLEYLGERADKAVNQ